MSKEKKIEEMAEEITDVWNNKCQFTTCKGCKYNDFNDNKCQEKLIADHLITIGYRKQSEPISRGHEKGSEWISVEERLPDREGKYLVCTTNGNIGVGNFIDYYGKGTHLCFDCWAVTHWMPLPEAPKGGAE